MHGFVARAPHSQLHSKGNVVLDKSFGAPRITKDGVTVAKEIELSDKFENMGAQMVREVASKTSDVAGDGTTTATVLAQAIVREGAKAVAAGMNPMDLKRGIDRAVQAVVEDLKKRTKKITTPAETAQVGAVAANGETEIGKMISEAMQKVGNEGVITVEEAKGNREKLQKRLAKLAGGVAVIRVGGSTEVEVKERKDRVDDALHATRAAVEEGIVPGGGVALLRGSKALFDHKVGGDEQIGVDIVRRACEEPLRQIVVNSGTEGAIVVEKIRENNNHNFGFNAMTDTYEDLVAAGVIDPTKVTRTALQNAASIASLMLTPEALIAEIPEKKAAPAGGPGGHGPEMDY